MLETETMARSTATWAVFIALLIVALVTFFAVRGGLGPAPAAPDDETTDTSETPSEPVETPAASAAAPIDAEWPMFHGCQEQLGRADGALADSLSLLWKFETGDQVKSSPVVADSRVFVGSSDENLYALDVQTGEKLWVYGTEGVIENIELRKTRISVEDDTVVIGNAAIEKKWTKRDDDAPDAELETEPGTEVGEGAEAGTGTEEPAAGEEGGSVAEAREEAGTEGEASAKAGTGDESGGGTEGERADTTEDRTETDEEATGG